MKKTSLLISALITACIAICSCNKGTVDADNPGLGLGAGGSYSISSKQKSISVLAMIANVNFNLITTSESRLFENTKKIETALSSNTTLRDYIGTDWDIVWGPAISNSKKKNTDSFLTDNTMYIAKGKDDVSGEDIYVVAIAGTNILSKKGWVQEDFNVFTKQDWGKPNSGKISSGTGVGLDVLLQLTDPISNKTALQFFESLGKETSYEIACTGHSLGGALAPVMALKIIEWKERGSYRNMSISTYPIAGATPGDKEFATYAASKFGNNYFSVINHYDIVPNSWQYNMYSKIPDLYNNPLFNSGVGYEFPQELKKTYEAFKIGISTKQYTRIATDKEFVFNGTPNVYNPITSGSFVKEAAYQHTQAYFKDAFNFPEPIIEVIGSLISN